MDREALTSYDLLKNVPEDSVLAPPSDDNAKGALTECAPEVPPLERLSVKNEPVPSSPCFS